MSPAVNLGDPSGKGKVTAGDAVTSCRVTRDLSCVFGVAGVCVRATRTRKRGGDAGGNR